MSTTTFDHTFTTRETPHRPGLARLTKIELRKMVDTRAGFWLLLGVLATIALVVILTCTSSNPDNHTLQHLLANALQPASALLPIAGILLVSSEYSQRTTLTTFTLTPHRGRVFAAKLAAAVLVSLVALVACLAVAAVGAAFVAPAGGWAMPGWMVGQSAVMLATAMVIGVGFGAALLSSAPAIVLYFVLPVAWSALGTLKAVEGPARWLDSDHSLAPLSDEAMSAMQWAHASTTLLLWMVLPVVVGAWRIMRSDVR